MESILIDYGGYTDSENNENFSFPTKSFYQSKTVTPNSDSVEDSDSNENENSDSNEKENSDSNENENICGFVPSTVEDQGKVGDL